ncbi:HAD family hydrolase [Lachnospiraceae bacterium LCP19S3_B12]
MKWSIFWGRCEMGASLIFDYDGTIHDTLRIYEPALRRAFKWLEEEHGVRVPHTSRQRIASWLGMNRREMWDSFLPGLPVELREEAGAMVGAHMERAVRARRAAWYPGIRPVLEELKDRGCRLAVLSNCQASYGRVHWETFGMDRWFEGFYDCESFGYAPKTQIIRQIGKEFPGPYVVIGDRRIDMECARASGSPFIGCRYGFGIAGELAGADVMAEKPEDILAGILKTL